MQAHELELNAAIEQAPVAASSLALLAEGARQVPYQPNEVHISRTWVPSAGTFCYQTHIAISAQSRERFEWAADLFFNAAKLDSQPWYGQFLGGDVEACELSPAGGMAAHQLCIGAFDLGVGKPRAYRQLVSLQSPEPDTAVIVARSINQGPSLEGNPKLAYTLDPNGEVLHWDGQHLHWHHICCTPGAAILPQPFDRYLINGLRRLGLDSAERKTYRTEAEQFRDWLFTLD